MKTPYRASWQVTALCLLVLADLGWRIWSWTHPRVICATTTSINGKPFMLQANHHTHVDAISMHKEGAKNWDTIWAEWDLDQDGRADTASYFFEGRNVFNVNLRAGQPPRFDVYMYGPGKSVTWWLDRGNGSSFTDRIYYDTNGIQVQHEVLHEQTWRVVETRGRQKGVLADGKWVPLHFTNDSPNLNPPPVPAASPAAAPAS